MEAQSRLGWRAISALIGAAARSSARTLATEPPKRPIGVRTASHTNTSPIESLPEYPVFRAGRSELRLSFRSGAAAGQLMAHAPAVLSREVRYALNCGVTHAGRG